MHVYQHLYVKEWHLVDDADRAIETVCAGCGERTEIPYIRGLVKIIERLDDKLTDAKRKLSQAQ